MKQISRSMKLAGEGSRRGWIKTEGEDDVSKCALCRVRQRLSTALAASVRESARLSTCPTAVLLRTAPPSPSLLPSIASLLKPPPSNNRHHRLRTLLRSFR